ncbi:hypothetical protein [Absidia glauca]|uniref:Uncharacterized protein n=1 Tax=Absidia glauca TaxID=4829 RepID=A0A163MAQ4_ABSGL|nr:hypothetical protein [Absidia glauca]
MINRLFYISDEQVFDEATVELQALFSSSQNHEKLKKHFNDMLSIKEKWGGPWFPDEINQFWHLDSEEVALNHDTALAKIKALLESVSPEHLEDIVAEVSGWVDSLTRDAAAGKTGAFENTMNEKQPEAREELYIPRKRAVNDERSGQFKTTERTQSFTLPTKGITKGRPVVCVHTIGLQIKLSGWIPHAPWKKKITKKANALEKLNSGSAPTKITLAKWESNSCFIDCIVEVIQILVLKEIGATQLNTVNPKDCLLVKLLINMQQSGKR